MKPDIHHHAEPAVHTPELRALVDLARAQPPRPAPADEFERLHRGVAAARQAQTRRYAAFGGLALAAGLAALALTRLDLGMSDRAGPSGHVAQDMSQVPAAHEAAVRPLGPVLADGVRVVAAADETPTPTVLGPWEVGLAPGRYEVEVADHPGPELLRARSAGGTVELHHGRVEIVVAGSATTATLREGVATWIAPDGARSQLTAPAAVATDVATGTDATTTDVTPPNSPAEPDVRLLARRAEDLLTAGKRDPAIKVLTQIVTQHPHEPAARGALLDLAPLLKAAGRVDEARCAYQLYLGRYAGKAQLADEVQKALGRLGEGPACRGLKPRQD